MCVVHRQHVVCTCLSQGVHAWRAGAKPGARSAPAAAQKPSAVPGQGKKHNVAEGDGGEAEAPPPDNKSWIQVSLLHLSWINFQPLCDLLSIQSECVKISCRAATELLGATDWLQMMPKHFAVLQKNWIFLIPAALMVSVHFPSSFCAS